MAYVPSSAAEIDPAWLEAAMAEKWPGRTLAIESVSVADTAEVTNSHAWLRVRYAGAETSSNSHLTTQAKLPESLFCKLLPSDPTRRVAIAQTQMGLREARFYQSLAPQLSLRVPISYVSRYEDDAGGAFILLLEDLNESGCTVSSGPESPSPDAAAKALEDLAAMHVHLEDPEVRRREASWVSEPDPPSDYGSMRLAEGLAEHRDKLSPAFAEMSEVYIEKRDALHEVWKQGPKTVIHGDTHIGNLFFDGFAIGFLDWGLVVVSTPLRDVSYFLNMCLSIEDRRAHQERLIRHYLDVRHALGGTDISFDDAWAAHRLHAAYLAPASCQIVTFPEDITERRRHFAAAFLARAEAAIEDLESRAALKAFAGI